MIGRGVEPAAALIVGGRHRERSRRSRLLGRSTIALPRHPESLCLPHPPRERGGPQPSGRDIVGTGAYEVSASRSL